MRVEAGQLRQWRDRDDHTVRYGTFLAVGVNMLRTEEQGDGIIWDIMTDRGLDWDFESVIAEDSEVVGGDG